MKQIMFQENTWSNFFTLETFSRLMPPTFEKLELDAGWDFHIHHASRQQQSKYFCYKQIALILLT